MNKDNMCARYSLGLSETSRPKVSLPERLRRANIAPSLEIAAVHSGHSLLEGATWGMKPAWSKSLLINARSETVAEKPFYRGLLKSQRCLIPATGFFEWREENGRKQPYRFRLKSQAPFWMAGLWRMDDQKSAPGVVILTTSPNELMFSYHNRMPVLIADDDAEAWLNSDNQIISDLLPLLIPAPAEPMEVFPVNPEMGKPGYQGDDLETPWHSSSLF